MGKDRLYRKPTRPVPPFTFNAAVADVFDDMIRRSVPMYDEIIRRQTQLVARHHRAGPRIYDLGCSTGNLTVALCRRLPADAPDLVAVDNAAPMLAILKRRLEKIDPSDRVTLLCEDIRQLVMRRAGVVAANFTLQFLAPADRDTLLQRVYDALVPGGILLLSEKTVHTDPDLAELQVDFYYRFKRENGYSALEISQKREALENVLVPETEKAHRDRLQRCGFAAMDVWLKWFNFCSWICVK